MAFRVFVIIILAGLLLAWLNYPSRQEQQRRLQSEIYNQSETCAKLVQV